MEQAIIQLALLLLRFILVMLHRRALKVLVAALIASNQDKGGGKGREGKFFLKLIPEPLQHPISRVRSLLRVGQHCGCAINLT